MPRRPTKLHVLRTIREILGLSQVAFAKKIGVAPVTIKKIENHTVPMSKNTAELIGAFTGASQEQLLENTRPAEPKNHWGDPYTKEWFETEYKSEITKGLVDTYVADITVKAQMALDACASVRSRDGEAVAIAFLIAIEDITHKFQLDSKVNELMSKFLASNIGVPSARAQYYAELEEMRALKTKARQKAPASKKPVRPGVSRGSGNGN
jgi:transcriptional regulator with XRE-family HTH domain